MGIDLRDLLRERLIIHPRLAQQNLWTAPGAAARLAADLPPLVPFGDAEYIGADWVLDWDHRLPSLHAVLRVSAYYTEERRREAAAVIEQRRLSIGSEDLFPEFDVPDLAGIPADEAYEAELEIGSPPARLRLVSEWRREIDPVAAEKAVHIVRESPSFKEIKARVAFRPPGLGDLEAAEWSPPCESGHARWGIDVWYLMTYNGMVGEGRAFLVDGQEPLVVRERDFQFRAG
ncbi:MAG: hypothetical protein ABUL77_01575 [Bacteroidota bacterium]